MEIEEAAMKQRHKTHEQVIFKKSNQITALEDQLNTMKSKVLKMNKLENEIEDAKKAMEMQRETIETKNAEIARQKTELEEQQNELKEHDDICAAKMNERSRQIQAVYGESQVAMEARIVELENKLNTN